MGSTRVNATGETETIASNVQPAGYHNATEVVENSGIMLWDGTGWVTPAGDTQPTGAHNAKSQVLNAGQMLWESVKKEWIPASSGNTKDGESASEVLPVQNLLLNSAGTMDRQRNNVHGAVALASAARTSTAATGAIVNYNWSKLSIGLDITVNPGATKTLTVSVFQAASPTNLVVCRFKAVEGSWLFQLAPGLEAEQIKGSSSDAYSANGVVPAQFLLQVIPSDASSWTYEVTYDLLV
jgi:hypothetical protein